MHAIARNCALAGRRRCKCIKLAHAKWSIKPGSNFGERSCIYMSTSRKEAQTVCMTNCPHTWLWLLKENEGVEGGAEALGDAFFTLKHFLRWLEKLIKTYHLSSVAILELLEEVGEDLEPETRGSHSKLWSWFVTALNVADCSHQQALGGEVGRNSDQGANWNRLTFFPACPRSSSGWTRPIATFQEHRTREASCPHIRATSSGSSHLGGAAVLLQDCLEDFLNFIQKSHEQVKSSVIYFTRAMATEKLHITKAINPSIFCRCSLLHSVAQACWSPSQPS